MKSHILIILFAALTVNFLFSQFTIGFYSVLPPTGDGQIHLAEGWTAEDGQPDLFCHGGGSGYGIPFTAQGYQDDPNCFAGLSDGDGISTQLDLPAGEYRVVLYAKNAHDTGSKKYLNVKTDLGTYPATIESQGPWDVYSCVAKWPGGQSKVSIESPFSPYFEYTFLKQVEFSPHIEESEPENPLSFFARQGENLVPAKNAKIISMQDGKTILAKENEPTYLRQGMYYVAFQDEKSGFKIVW